MEEKTRKPNQGGKSIFGGSNTPTRKLHIVSPGKVDPKLAEKLRTNNLDGKPPITTSVTDGKPSKVDQKSYEDITAQSVVKLPKNQVRPVNQRIFCIAINPGEMKTEGGIILPTEYTSAEAKGSQKRSLFRYFVVDVADDCSIRYGKMANIAPSKIERGDEVFPFIPVEAVDFKFPTVHDFYNHEDYIVLHETELGGVGISSLLAKEKE